MEEYSVEIILSAILILIGLLGLFLYAIIIFKKENTLMGDDKDWKGVSLCPQGVSLCPHCNCITKTIKGECGKCGGKKC